MVASTRVLFHLPSENEFTNLLGDIPLSTVGGGLDNINRVKFATPTRLHQRGGGFFSSLANLAKSAAPFLVRAIAPSAVKFTQDVIQDVSSGQRGLRGALKKRGIEALRGVGSRLMQGGKKKRQKLASEKKKKLPRERIKQGRKRRRIIAVTEKSRMYLT